MNNCFKWNIIIIVGLIKIYLFYDAKWKLKKISDSFLIQTNVNIETNRNTNDYIQKGN